MLRYSIVIFINLFLYGCSKPHGYKSMAITLFPLINGATEIEILHSEINKSGNLTFPANTWISLLSFKNNEKYCLVFKTPFNKENLNIRGELKLVKTKSKCEEQYFLSTGSHWKNFEFLRLQYNEGSFKPGLKFTGEIKSKTREAFDILVPMYNLSRSPIYEKFSHSINQSYYPGLTIFVGEEEKLNSDFSKGFDWKEVKFCHVRDNQCKDEFDESCINCYGAIRELVGGKCLLGYDKICGNFDCGTTGNPACPRGNLGHVLEADKCENKMKMAFCQKGLVKFCDNGYVFCR
jgi:hypothetical protein